MPKPARGLAASGSLLPRAQTRAPFTRGGLFAQTRPRPRNHGSWPLESRSRRHSPVAPSHRVRATLRVSVQVDSPGPISFDRSTGSAPPRARSASKPDALHSSSGCLPTRTSARSRLRFFWAFPSLPGLSYVPNCTWPCPHPAGRSRRRAQSVTNFRHPIRMFGVRPVCASRRRNSPGANSAPRFQYLTWSPRETT